MYVKCTAGYCSRTDKIINDNNVTGGRGVDVHHPERGAMFSMKPQGGGTRFGSYLLYRKTAEQGDEVTFSVGGAGTWRDV